MPGILPVLGFDVLSLKGSMTWCFRSSCRHGLHYTEAVGEAVDLIRDIAELFTPSGVSLDYDLR